MAVVSALDALGLYWKRDADFSLGGGVVELLATGPKWFDTRAKVGGGGAIDLAMHLLRLDFVLAVK